MSKMEFTEKGWKITKVEHFCPKTIRRNFMTRESWMDFTAKRVKKETPGNAARFRCQCCRTPWDLCQGEYVGLALMDKHSNHVLCQSCIDVMEENQIKIV